MKCYEVKESTLSEFDRLYAHGVNVREFGSCPVCDDLNKPIEKSNRCIWESSKRS